MDKLKIKHFAVESRQQLVRDVRQVLANYGIDKYGIKKELNISTTNVKYYTNENFPLRGDKITWRKNIVTLLERDKNKDWDSKLDEFIEEVAYTWFNRIIAIRFMEINDYLPSHTRVLSSEEGRLDPDIITHAMEIEDYLGGYTNDEKKMISNALTNHNPNEMDEVFKMLFIKQTDMLSSMLPGLFEKTSEYLKLLFTPRYNHGIIKKLVDEIPEEYFDVSASGQVSIIGWLYQYYISELHDQVVNIANKKEVEKDDIPAATQLFTTDWVVRYMVDNSLGKYYLERHPKSNLAKKFKYLLPTKINQIHDNKKLEDYKFIDDAMGSGHILIYAFDIFMDMYREEGYSSTEATQIILSKNLFGLEIDKRAYQLSYFALMMKARQYDRYIFNRDIKLNIFLFRDINLPDVFYEKLPEKTSKKLKEIFADFANATEYGSVINIMKNYNWDTLWQAVNNIKIDGTLDLDGIQTAKTAALDTLNIIKILTDKYEIVVTNPPYLNKFDEVFKKYLKENYNKYSKDLFSVFILKNINLLTNDGYAGFMTPLVWMFIKTYEPLRNLIINQTKIDSLIQMEYSAYEEATVPIDTFVLKNSQNDFKGTYVRLSAFKGGMEVQRQKVLKAIDSPKCKYLYYSDQRNFCKIPGSPIAYWAPAALIKDFEKGTPLEKLVDAKQGLATANNKLFLRYWYEVDVNKICFNAHNTEEAVESGKKWFPYNKGGAYRKWYGNYDYVVNWEKNGKEIKNYTDKNGKLRSRPQNTDYYFKEALTWSDITSGSLSARYRNYGSIHDVTGMSAFKKSCSLSMILGLINSKVGDYIFKILNPTIHAQIGNFINLPYLDITNSEVKQKVEQKVEQNIEISKKDWDSNEISWEYDHNGLLNSTNSLEVSYEKYHNELARKFKQEQKNEEEINKFFIDLYKLNNELDYSVEPKNISLKDPNKVNEKKTEIKNFLSYFVGCLFGRYSLDKDGLIFAGGQFDLSNYKSFIPNEDNIILLTDRDYFGDNRDIFNRLKEFLTITFDKEHLSENMHFIAQVLDSKKVKRGATDEQIIRNYFSNDFYKEHDEMYHKRPIYWQFTSGRNNGFKALMYLHRYNTNELAMARNYLYQLQNAYINTIKLDEERLSKVNSNRERNQYVRDIAKLKKKVNEIINYDESLNHQALAQVKIDLDDGVLVNHAKIQGKKHLLSNL